MTRTAVVVGASSGIGRALAAELADAGYEVGLAARRLSKLESLGDDLATWSMAHLEERGGGHLVGISSVAGLFGNPVAPAYNASKAFVSRYLDGLRSRAAAADADVTVTDVVPGFVDTEMAMGETFWMASPETAAAQIHDAVRAERNRVYVTRRWRLVALLLRLLPESALRRLFD
ncbi:hypothetical protein C474_12916 [Halogeometricum pallidum JCM 14848]|uniref:Short-chain dehydrogenase/reductase SDR n=1 Tax=Halogeometricum pallidum JCM 14848 TaxID=1227487 RepID=M0D333_HALPD|nr:SDR family NAD(P)-dependent oxidoreductase [Halogeometricum pallidum]ELZ29936.1 hypothetical protein C474_12916 [Halogeometricum pallidum JCM 14848]